MEMNMKMVYYGLIRIRMAFYSVSKNNVRIVEYGSEAFVLALMSPLNKLISFSNIERFLSWYITYRTKNSKEKYSIKLLATCTVRESWKCIFDVQLEL